METRAKYELGDYVRFQFPGHAEVHKGMIADVYDNGVDWWYNVYPDGKGTEKWMVKEDQITEPIITAQTARDLSSGGAK